MKINVVPLLIALAISLLIAYGFYNFQDNENKMLLSAGSFIFLSIALILTIGITFELPRTTTNVRALSGIFFVVALLSNFIFTFVHFAVPTYIIINGILLLVFILLAYSIIRAKQ